MPSGRSERGSVSSTLWLASTLQARLGIATGLVVVGDLIGEGWAQEQSVVGETPNLAARLQALAEPGAVVIAAATRRLIGDLFEASKPALALLTAALVLQSAAVKAQSPTQDPCAGPLAFLAIVDRPTVADSACVVPDGNVVLELGAQRSKNRDGSRGFNLPEAELRFGIPGNNELVALPPNYAHQAGGGLSASGAGSTVVGVKHELGYTAKWLGAVESLVTLPSGNAAFGSAGTGVAFNGIVSYSPTSNTGLSMMLGVSTQTLSHNNGGGRYTSINPDFVATWAPADRWQLYAEIYGQSRTSPSQGMGWNADGGLQYLVTPDVEVDVEFGFKLTGKLGDFRNYVGIGLGLRF